jgi:hypothetical protein
VLQTNPRAIGVSIPNQHRDNIPNQLSLTIWGDPIAGQALVLLLRGSGYKAEFVAALPSSEPSSLGDTQLLVLTPTPRLSTEQREALLTSLLRSNMQGATDLQVLELVVPSEETQEERMQNASWHAVPWPCGLENLEQHIEATVLATL